MVYWRESLYGFSSRDAIIVVGFVLEKHIDGDFTADHEKDITFKRWPPGYQSWKLSLALNGLTLWACIVRFRTAASMVAFLNSPKVFFVRFQQTRYR